MRLIKFPFYTIAASVFYTSALAEEPLSFQDAIQFSLHVGAPYPINLKMEKRAQITKWDHNPNLRVEGSIDSIKRFYPYFERAISFFSENYEFHPIISEVNKKIDITAVLFDSTEFSKAARLKRAIVSGFDYDWGEIDMDSRIEEHVHPEIPCSTFVFDYEADLRRASPYVIILVDTSSPYLAEDGFVEHCVFEEVGHATTFFADIPLELDIRDALISFDTIYEASGTPINEITSFTPDDVRMLGILNRSEIKNGNPVQPLINSLIQSNTRH